MIYCAKCKKLVDKIEVHDDLNNNARVFTVYCHGEKETKNLSHKDMVEILGLSGGVAFKEEISHGINLIEEKPCRQHN